MNYSDLLAEGTLARSLKEQLSHLTWYDAAVFANESILRTSYWIKSGSVVRDAFLAGALEGGLPSSLVGRFSSPEAAAAVPFSQSEAVWMQAARELELPDALPRSVDSILKVERQRREIIPMTIWDSKLTENCGILMAQHGISRPGAFAPALFVGPTGASKTHSVLALYPALGIAVNLIEGTPALTSDVRIENITGGARGKGTNFETYVKDLASKGYFQTQKARLAYFRALVDAAKEGGCDLVDAHDRIPHAQWTDLAKTDGYPLGEPTFQVYYPGKIRLGMVADQVNLVDEVNKFTVENQQDLRNHLSSEGQRFGFNTVFAFTANPASDEYQGRAALGADILGCCHRKIIEPRSPQQYAEYVRTQLGVQSEDMVTAQQVLELIVANNPRSPDRSVPTDISNFKTRDHIPLLGRLLPRDVVTELGDRIGRLQTEFEAQAIPGGKIHPTTYSLQVDASKPSVRSVSAFLKRINDSAFMAILEKGAVERPLTALNGLEISSIISEAVDERYISPFRYETDGPTQLLSSEQITNQGDALDHTGNSTFLNGAVARAGLNSTSLDDLLRDINPGVKLTDAQRRFALETLMLHEQDVRELTPEKVAALDRLDLKVLAGSSFYVRDMDEAFFAVRANVGLLPTDSGAYLDQLEPIPIGALEIAIKSGAFGVKPHNFEKSVVIAKVQTKSHVGIASVTWPTNQSEHQIGVMTVEEYKKHNIKSLADTGLPYAFDQEGRVTRDKSVKFATEVEATALEPTDLAYFKMLTGREPVTDITHPNVPTQAKAMPASKPKAPAAKADPTPSLNL